MTLYVVYSKEMIHQRDLLTDLISGVMLPDALYLDFIVAIGALVNPMFALEKFRFKALRVDVYEELVGKALRQAGIYYFSIRVYREKLEGIEV